MKILTIYNHGSGGSSLKPGSKGEIINLFGNNDGSDNLIGKIITEGVGSIGNPEKQKIYPGRDPQSGDYNLSSEINLSGNFLTRLKNNIAGTGVEANVLTVLEIIKLLNLSGRCPEAINMLGWSRGAVTSIRIAYFLHQMKDPVLRAIPINIFGLDPVPGPGHNSEIDAITITPNVRNYVTTYMMGERGSGFTPLNATAVDPKITKSLVLPFRGNHSSGAKNTTSEGRITFNLAARFLWTHGTDCSPMAHYLLSNAECWKLYENILTSRSVKVPTGEQKAFNKPQGKIKAFFTRGGVSTRKEVASSDSDFFLNAHAKALFLAEFNDTFRAYFGAGKESRNTIGWATKWGPKIGAEMNRIDSGVTDVMLALGPTKTSPEDAALGQSSVAIVQQNRFVD